MLHYETHKLAPDKPWLVFLHGAGGSVKTWTYQVPYFAAQFNLLLIDLRDHGKSKNVQPVLDQYHFELISEDIKRVLDFENIENAYFMTLSFGSVLLQDLYMRYPYLVKGTVIAGGIFKGSFFIRSFVYLARVFNLFLRYSTMYRLFSYLLMPRRHHELSRRIYQRQAAKLSQAEYMKWVGLYGEFFKLLKLFYYQSLNIKTLIIMGEEDYVFLKAAHSFNMKQPKAILKTIPEAGHIVNIDGSTAFNQLAMTFLQKVEKEDHSPKKSPGPIPLNQ